jgi:hypothetical protein
MNKQSALHFESCRLQPHVVRCIKRVACGSLFAACGMLRSCTSLGVNTCFLYVHTLTTAVSAPTRSLSRSMPHHLHPVSTGAKPETHVEAKVWRRHGCNF